MAVRIYLSPVLTWTHRMYPDFPDRYAGSVVEYLDETLGVPRANAWRVVLQKNADGTAFRDFCIVIVDADDHTRYLSDARLRPLPDRGLDLNFTPAQRTAVLAELVNRGITSSSNTLREVIRDVVRYIRNDVTVSDSELL